MPRVSKEDIDVIRRSGLFDEAWYLEEYPDVKILEMDPVEHYLWLGARIGRNPSPNFDSWEYLRCNPNVAAADLNPLLHFVKYGVSRG